MIQIEVSTTSRREMVHITERVQRAVDELGAVEGACQLFVPHTTAALVLNENADPDVVRDLLAAYEAMIPAVRFRHGEGNSDAHLLSSLLGSSLLLPIHSRRLRLGTWQGVYFVELDGPRRRSVWVTLL